MRLLTNSTKSVHFHLTPCETYFHYLDYSSQVGFVFSLLSLPLRGQSKRYLWNSFVRHPQNISKPPETTPWIVVWIGSNFFPRAIPNLRWFSPRKSVLTLISRSLEAGGGATVFREQGWFKTLLKRLTHFADCSRSVVSMRPPRSLKTVDYLLSLISPGILLNFFLTQL